MDDPADMELTELAFNILMDDLHTHGNQVGTMQKEALRELVGEMTRFSTGATSGRKAFSLGTGCGKTSAIVAWITALHRLGLEHVSVSIAASKVQALCSIKEELMRHGVPEGLIGLKYAHCPEAPLPSTGNEDRRYQLVTHARVRGSTDQDLFILHRGQPRALMIYDETLFRAEAFPVLVLELKKNLVSFLEEVKERKNKDDYLGFIRFLQDAVDTIQEHIEGDDTTPTFTLPPLSQVELDGFKALLGESPEWTAIRQFLEICQEELRVTKTEQGTGVIWYELVIPTALENVLILDASYPIRKLVHLDPTITNGSSYADKEVKRFDRVTIRRMKAPSGRNSMTRSFSQKRKEERDISREVVELVKELPPEKSTLIFTFKHRPGEVDIPETLKWDFTDAGIDLEARTPNGHPRYTILTWGDETSLNHCSHCEVVILAGILHRSAMDIAARIIGQQDNLKAQTGNGMVRDILTSEMAHMVYQALSRGACRVVEDDQAKAMDAYLIHANDSLEEPLAKVMPGVRWRPWQRKHPRADDHTITDKLALKVLEFLNTIPDHTERLATRLIRDALELGTDATDRNRLSRAIQQVCREGEWMRKGHALVITRCLFEDC